ncbi:DUF1190 domain-containing protein [Lysobacter humi (ex Lee et al. 2017)]
MKRSKHLRLALVATVPMALAGCDNPGITGAQNADQDWGTAQVTQTGVDCSTAERMQTEDCKLELERVLAASPRYGSQGDCEGALGAPCGQVNENGSALWIGPVTGFVGGMLLAEALDEVGDAYARKRRYDAGYRAGGYRSGYPATTGRPGYPTTATPPPAPPTRAISESRSGFGSTSSARNSFGRGWGG